MPMIEFRYLPAKVSRRTARDIGSQLESGLRQAISGVRPLKGEYKVSVEGDRFDIAFNQPDFRIYIHYHEEWGFDSEEKEKLASYFESELQKILSALGQSELYVIARFYARTGHIKATPK